MQSARPHARLFTCSNIGKTIVSLHITAVRMSPEERDVSSVQMRPLARKEAVGTAQKDALGVAVRGKRRTQPQPSATAVCRAEPVATWSASQSGSDGAVWRQ